MSHGQKLSVKSNLEALLNKNLLIQSKLHKPEN